VDGFRIDWHEAKLKSLREKRASAGNWRKSSFDERIREREKRLRQAKRDAASDASQRANLLSGAFSEHVQKLEQIYTELTARLPEPILLIDIEEHAGTASVTASPMIRPRE